MIAVPVIVSCYPRGFQVPVAYKANANADMNSIACAKERFVERGYDFYTDPVEGREILGVRDFRVARDEELDTRGREFVRVELKEVDGREVMELTLGINRRIGTFDPQANPPSKLSLDAPSLRSIDGADEVLRSCQSSPFR